MQKKPELDFYPLPENSTKFALEFDIIKNARIRKF